ncbi:hypothetical protein BD560DRAFT_412206 [Blakeslea trispora]|nr:hypothetical protein BD560DRAFT_412206 [Blakeslea trispora]
MTSEDHFEDKKPLLEENTTTGPTKSFSSLPTQPTTTVSTEQATAEIRNEATESKS